MHDANKQVVAVLRRLIAEGRITREQLRAWGASSGAIISPGDYLARLDQINTWIRALDRDIQRSRVGSQSDEGRRFREEWERWFGEWTAFYAANNSWISGLTGGALQQAEEHLLRAREWRTRFEALVPGQVTTPGAGPTPGGPADRDRPLLSIETGATLQTVAIAAVVVVAAVIVLPRLT